MKGACHARTEIILSNKPNKNRDINSSYASWLLGHQVEYKTLGSFTLRFGLKYEIIYQLDAIEYLFVFFQLDIFQAYTPIFRSNGCYNFFTYAAYGVLGVVRCRS